MKKVLIVDDATFMRISIKNMLTKNGYDVIGEAENGKVALQKYQELTPDIVTMDITMPEMDGLASLKQILSFNTPLPRSLWFLQWDKREWFVKL